MRYIIKLFAISILSTACHSTTPISSDALDDPGSGLPPFAGFVVSKLSWPGGAVQARDYAFDVDGDNIRENQLGNAVASMVDLFPSQPTQDVQIALGELLLLADLETDDPITSGDASFTVFVGIDPMPAPCGSGGCGQHLTGTGSFGVARSPRETPLHGGIRQRTFTSERGLLPIQFSIMESAPVSLTLRYAQAEIFQPSLGGLSGRIGGAILETDMTSKVYPAMRDGLAGMIARDCGSAGVPPSCGCSDGSRGYLAIGFFDSNPKDCKISVAEVASSSFRQQAFRSDIGVDGEPAISVAFAVTAVPATLQP